MFHHILNLTHFFALSLLVLYSHTNFTHKFSDEDYAIDFLGGH